MAIYEITIDRINLLEETKFEMNDVLERDLQRLLRNQIEIIAPNTMVISEEFGDWEDSRRRIDLLAVDSDANLVVIELKRTEDGGHMDLQAIRYASMISTMTFERAVSIYAAFLKKTDRLEDVAKLLLDFLGWDEPIEAEFAQDVRIILASAEFKKEITSTAMWLRDHNIDIQCVRLKPYKYENRVLIDVQQLIPLPDTVDYQVQLNEKMRTEREERTGSRDYTKFNLQLADTLHTSINKRKAMLLVCKYLTSNGIPPDAISERIGWRRNNLWYHVEGIVDAEKFSQAAIKKAQQNAKAFDSRRWFCGDQELIYTNNRTYALANQWGPRTQEALTILSSAFPGCSFLFKTETSPLV